LGSSHGLPIINPISGVERAAVSKMACAK
jgi:hypothetical protein